MDGETDKKKVCIPNTYQVNVKCCNLPQDGRVQESTEISRPAIFYWTQTLGSQGRSRRPIPTSQLKVPEEWLHATGVPGVNTAATVMTDVNSFGISMIEIATPRRPNWPVTFDGVGVGLVEWARKMAEPNREMEMLGVNVSNERLVLDDVKEYFRIASLCTSEVTRGRPAMSQVVKMLKEQMRFKA
ncbi:hypothetical protein SLA2020_379240 [Shorea laevis]